MHTQPTVTPPKTNTIIEQEHIPHTAQHSDTPKNHLTTPPTAKIQEPPIHKFQSYDPNQKVIEGYNFESLFRKKSHIRLARKKNRQQSQKRSNSAKPQGREREARHILKGHWSTEENKLYHWFLEIHSRHFVLKHLRRTDKIFKSMASFIGSREAQQCRSHHQKMQKKYHSFHQILLKLRNDFYQSSSPDALRVDLQAHGYRLKEASLIGQAELRSGQLLRGEGNQDQLQQDSLMDDLQQSQKQGNNHSNILGQNYENGLHFNTHL